MKSHDEKISLISCQFKESNDLKEKVKVQKDNVSHIVPFTGLSLSENKKIKIGNLKEIIFIDSEKKICIAESGITFSELVKETLKYNLVPYLVPELKTITIGGAVSGCSVESMSYKYGGFFDSCLEIEAITSNGEILNCSPHLNSDIFYMLHGSFGTIARITKIKFKLLDAGPFVKIDYHKSKNLKDFHSSIHFYSKDPNIDFIDGIIHSNEKYVLCTGKFIDNVPFTSDYTGINIYYKSTAYKDFDYLTTFDYFFRYDTECHWLTRNYGLESFLPRILFGKHILGSTNILNLINKYPILNKINTKPLVIVDLFLPDQNLEKFFVEFQNKFNYYPVWIVPYRMPKTYDWINIDYAKENNSDLWIDMAIYGMKQNYGENSYKTLESMLNKYKGLKTLISYNYYDEDNFWKIYNKEKYFAVKRKTDPNNIFGDIFTRTKSK
jgi:hypothetical protein